MSKRWGRNQRRRLRAEVEQAQQAATQAQAAARAAAAVTMQKERELRVLCGRVRYAFEALQSMPNTGLLPAEREQGNPRHRYRLPVRSAGSETIEFDPHAAHVRRQPEVIQQLLRVEFAIDYQQRELQYNVHLIVEGSGPLAGSWSYQASDLRLRAGIPPDIRKRFAEHIVDEVVAGHRFRSIR